MAYQKCPICNGVGNVSGGFYNRTGDCDTWVSNCVAEMCRTCQGKGIIVDDVKTWQESVIHKCEC